MQGRGSGGPDAVRGPAEAAAHPVVGWLTALADLTEASGGVLAELDAAGTGLAPRWWVGYPREVVESWRTIPLDAGVPLTEAATTGRPVVVSGNRDEVLARFPRLAGGPVTAPAGYVVVPLTDPEGSVRGVLGLTFRETGAVPGALEVVAPVAGRIARRLYGRRPGAAAYALLGAQSGSLPTPVRVPRGPAGTAERPTDALLAAAALVDGAVLRLIGDAPIGFAVLDEDLRFVLVNDHLAAINGLTAAEHVGRTLAEVVPDLADAAVESFAAVLASGRPLHELELSGEVASSPGVDRHWLESVFPVDVTVSRDADGTPHRRRGLAVVVREVTARVEADRERSRTLALLDLLIMRAPIGIAFLDADLRYLRINETLAAFNGVTVADHLGRTVAEVLPDVAPEVEPLLRGVLDTGVPVTDLELETGGTPAEPGRRRRWRVSYYPVPGPDGSPDGVGLIVTDETDRWDAQRQAERAGHRLALLARTSDLLSRSLDETAVLDAFAPLLLPELADWLVVLLPDGAGRLVTARSVHADPALAGVAAAAATAEPVPLAGDHPAAEVFRTQETRVTGDVRPHLGAATPVLAAAGLEPRAAVLAPMVVRGRTVGVLGLLETEPVTDAARAATAARRAALGGVAAEADLVTAVARRAGVALDNARLYGRRSAIATRLQEQLLPARLPDVPGTSLAVHYSTAEEAVDVGGDFYDVVPLGQRRWLLVIGDVAGRGVEAAGVTGLARHTLRALAHDLSPSAALTRLNDVLVAQGDDERFLTAACVLLDLSGAPGAATATFAVAGHCRPAVVRPDGRVDLVDGTGPLLGVLPDCTVGQTVLALGAGDALVLYTDGIVESRSGATEFGEQGLVAALAAVASPEHPARVVVDAVADAVAAFRAGPSDDDSALLVVRLDG